MALGVGKGRRGMKPDDQVWDLTDWFLRVAEALDAAAEIKGNTLHYGSAKKRAEPRPPTDRPPASRAED